MASSVTPALFLDVDLKSLLSRGYCLWPMHRCWYIDNEVSETCFENLCLMIEEEEVGSHLKITYNQEGIMWKSCEHLAEFICGSRKTHRNQGADLGFAVQSLPSFLGSIPEKSAHSISYIFLRYRLKWWHKHSVLSLFSMKKFCLKSLPKSKSFFKKSKKQNRNCGNLKQAWTS